jgi:hypothetical protein
MRMNVLSFLLLAGVVGTLAAAEVMDTTRLNQIIAEEASTNALPPQLAGLPRFPKSIQKVTFVFVNSKTNTVEHKGTEKYVETKSDGKTVDGRYIVSSLDMGADGRLFAITTYDPDLEVLRRWMLSPDGTITESLGLMDPTKHSVAWRGRFRDGRTEYLAVEMGEAKKVRWEARTFRDGRLLMKEEGTAELAE